MSAQGSVAVASSRSQSVARAGGASKAGGSTTQSAQILVLLLCSLTPFWQSAALNTGLFGMDALSIANLLPVVAFCAFIFTGSTDRLPHDRLGRAATVVYFCYLLLFAVAFARSLPYLDRFSAVDPAISNNVRSYVDAHLVVKCLMTMQFMYILSSFRSEDALNRLFAAISASLFVLSCIVIVAVLADPSVLSTPLRSGITKLTEAILGIHYNGAAAPYAIAAPLLAFLALKRGGYYAVNYLFAFVAVVFLESRTALILFVVMSVVTLIVCGRARALVAAVPLIGGVGVSALGPILLALLSVGFTSHSGFSLNIFLSGRDTAIWLPLIFEWWSDPSRFWFGMGEHGILTSDMLLTGRMLAVAVAHNAYLEFFLDNGIVGLVGLLAAITAFWTWALRMGRRIHTPLYWVLFCCLASFLMLSFTGHRFFPDSDNMFVFSFVAALINIARLKTAGVPPPELAPTARTKAAAKS
jgi:hypothetical protein